MWYDYDYIIERYDVMINEVFWMQIFVVKKMFISEIYMHVILTVHTAAS